MCLSRKDSANQSAPVTAVLGAMRRLLPGKSPSRYSTTNNRRACHSEIHYQSFLEVILVMGAHSGRTVGWCTPAQLPSARGMFAMLAKDTNYPTLRMLLAVHRCLVAPNVETCLFCTGGEYATPGKVIHHAFFSMLTAVCRAFAALHIEPGQPVARIV